MIATFIVADLFLRRQTNLKYSEAGKQKEQNKGGGKQTKINKQTKKEKTDALSQNLLRSDHFF